MAGYFGRYIIHWECMKPKVHNEHTGTVEWTGRNIEDAKSKFLEINPDYKVIKIEEKESE